MRNSQRKIKIMMILKVLVNGNDAWLCTTEGEFHVSKKFVEENHAVAGAFFTINDDLCEIHEC